MHLRGMLLDPAQENLADGGEADRFIRLTGGEGPSLPMLHVVLARERHHRSEPGGEIEHAREIAKAIASQPARFIAPAAFIDRPSAGFPGRSMTPRRAPDRGIRSPA